MTCGAMQSSVQTSGLVANILQSGPRSSVPATTSPIRGNTACKQKVWSVPQLDPAAPIRPQLRFEHGFTLCHLPDRACIRCASTPRQFFQVDVGPMCDFFPQLIAGFLTHRLLNRCHTKPGAIYRGYAKDPEKPFSRAIGEDWFDPLLRPFPLHESGLANGSWYWRAHPAVLQHGLCDPAWNALPGGLQHS